MLPSFLLVAVLALPAAEAPYVDEVAPIFQRRCVSCHGALKREGGLRLDAGQLVAAGGDSGPSIVPGDAAGSYLVERIATDDASYRMPPEGAPLKAEEIATIRHWIDTDGKPPTQEVPIDPRDHWAFRAPVRPPLPDLAALPRQAGYEPTAWVRNPIDQFVAARHAEQGVQPVPEADPLMLLRRVYLDLVGVPPSLQEMGEYEATIDRLGAEAAYRQLVDRLLADPRYAERWGRHWLDIWRYSDWYGYRAEVRNSQPHIWRWRDWVLESLDQDRPYDEMVRAMLAGDELAPEDPESLAATGYLVRSWFKFNRDTWLEATVEHSAKAFLGVTMNCARCHDHMYDPISQQDYYRFRAFFETHDVRTDYVDGTLDTKEVGLVRAFDGRLDAPTYLYERGDPRFPVKDRAYEPGLPSFLAAGLPEIQSVDLPPQAWYPELDPQVQAARLRAAESTVQAARTALGKLPADAKGDLVDATPDEQPEQRPEQQSDQQPQPKVVEIPAPAQRTVAELALAAAEAELESLRARIAAENAKHRPVEGGDDATAAATLATQAAELERQANFARALASDAQAKRALADNKDPKQQEKLKKAADTAEKAVATARDGLGKQGGNYTPLGKAYPKTTSGRRAALAQWITRPDNPLTARVAVSHVWLRHMDVPLVPAVFDFGNNGPAPTHPRLLDWLAVEFVESGWDLEHLHRTILTSATYRLASVADSTNEAADPDGLYYWRAPVRRMEAEVVRDSVLAVAGSLDYERGGPEIDHEQGLNVPRRSVYFRHAAEKQVEFLLLFDAASVNECYRRYDSIVPQQALALANSSLALSAAQRLAKELSARTDDDDAFVSAAYRAVLTREPTDAERSRCHRFLEQQTQAVADAEGDPKLRARANLVHVLLNLDAFVAIR